MVQRQVQIMAVLAAVALVLSVVETAQQMQLQIPVAAVAALRPVVTAMEEVADRALSSCVTQRLWLQRTLLHQLSQEQLSPVLRCQQQMEHGQALRRRTHINGSARQLQVVRIPIFRLQQIVRMY
jgi:hypothetical protein